MTSFDTASRPGYHFLPQSNWMNDPNGPFYDTSTGYHHLFYQYLTPRTWGHAISSNLIDWEILPTALNYTDEPYTQIPEQTPGVYSGSATIFTTSDGQKIPWLSASTPTNDMVILAFPTDLTDKKLMEWSWYDQNPVVDSSTTLSFPPGRDPTEFWKCGTSNDKYCVGYATQLSEGCPCSGISGLAIFSTTFNPSGNDATSADISTSGTSGVATWSDWAMEGYLLNDTASAVMWECPDLFPLFEGTSSDLWIVKYSIGPGPSYDLPWASPGPRDYYLTGTYSPETNILGFERDPTQWDAAMNRSTLLALDVGVFYASKTVHLPEVGRILWGWIPEERLVDSHGSPYGWAGVMALPRLIVPYQSTTDGSWFVRTPPLQSALDELYLTAPDSSLTQTDIVVTTSSPGEASLFYLDDLTGDQLEILVSLEVTGMSPGDLCGVRLLSSLSSTTPLPTQDTEFTDIGLHFLNTSRSANSLQSIELYVDTHYATANLSSPVNRTTCSAYPYDVSISSSTMIELQILLDHSVIESFLADGSRVITRRSYPTYPTTSNHLQLFASSGLTTTTVCSFSSVTIRKLRNANLTVYEESEDDGGNGSKNDDDELSSAMIGLIVSVVLVGVAGVGLMGYYLKRKSKGESAEREKMLN
jgi:sucrose-6-phosphate hydrolase SacC (GH32 family)